MERGLEHDIRQNSEVVRKFHPIEVWSVETQVSWWPLRQISRATSGAGRRATSGADSPAERHEDETRSARHITYPSCHSWHRMRGFVPARARRCLRPGRPAAAARHRRANKGCLDTCGRTKHVAENSDAGHLSDLCHGMLRGRMCDPAKSGQNGRG